VEGAGENGRRPRGETDRPPLALVVSYLHGNRDDVDHLQAALLENAPQRGREESRKPSGTSEATHRPGKAQSPLASVGLSRGALVRMSGALARIARNVGFTTGSQILGRLLFLALHAGLARAFGPDGLGAYATSLAIATYFLVAPDMGLSPRLVREGAIHRERLAEEYARALGLKLKLVLLALLALGGIYFVMPYPQSVRELCVLVGIASLVQSYSLLNQAVCRAEERLDLEAASVLVFSAAFVGASLLCIWGGLPIASIGFCAIAAALLQLIASTAFARRLVPLRLELMAPWSTARPALPYATTTVTSTAFTQIDVLILSVIVSQGIVGRYTSVSRLLLVTGFVAVMAGSAILPTASKAFSRFDRARFCNIVTGSLRFAGLLGGATTLAVFVTAEFALNLVYGEQFAPLYPLLRAGSIFVVLKFLTSVSSVMLTSCGRQGIRARAVLVGFAATALLVVTLVPFFGLAGAVTALVASELVLVGFQLAGLRDYLELRALLRTLIAVSFGAAAAIACFFAANQRLEQPLLAWGAALLAYGLVVLASGEVGQTVEFFRRRGLPEGASR